MSLKLRLIFSPFLFIAISFIGIYSFLDWYFVIQPQIATIKEDIPNYWLPAILPWIPVIIWLRPKLKLLNLKKNNRRSDPIFGLMFITAVTISITTIITQAFIETNTGKLTSLENIHEIKSAPLTKYYSLKNYYIDKVHCGIYRTSYLSGKYNSTLNFCIYITCPIYDTGEIKKPVSPPVSTREMESLSLSKALILLDGIQIDSATLVKISPDTLTSISILKGVSAKTLYGSKAANGVLLITTKKYGIGNSRDQDGFIQPVLEPKAWLCISYSKSISNRKSEDEKLSIRETFAENTMQLFKDSNLHSFVYLERTGNNDNRKYFRKAINVTNLSNDVDHSVLMKPVFTSFEKRDGHKVEWIFGSFAIGSALFILILYFLKLDETKVDILTGEILQK